MIEETIRVEGSPCQGYRYLPDQSSPKAVMHIVHGMAETAARYRPLAKALVADGWAIYAHDQRGHGQTVHDGDTLGHFADDGGWKLVLDDLGKFLAHEAEQHPGIPKVLFGHSMVRWCRSTWCRAGPSTWRRWCFRG